MKELWKPTLTNVPQTPYSKGGDNFMTTDSGQETQGGGIPQKPIEAKVKDQKNPPTKENQSLSVEEQKKVIETAEVLKKLSSDPEFQKQAQKKAEEAPEQEAVKKRRAETGGIKTYNQLRAPTGGIIDRADITNESLLRELDVIDDTAGLTKEIEEALGEATVRIGLMQEGKTPEEREKFFKEKDIVRERIKIKTLEVIKEKKDKMDANYRPQGLYGERKLTENEKIQIRNAKKPEEIEKLFNRMFDRVDSRPQAEFTAAFGSIGTFEYDEFTKTLNEAITENNDKGDVGRAKELTLIVQQYANERAARETIHNAYYGVLAGLDTESVSKFIDSFVSGWADMAFSKKGVTQAMHFYEQALLTVRESAGGYLKPSEVVGEMKKNSEGKVNELARDLLNKANDKGMLVVDEKGNPILDEQGKTKQLEPWQIERALAFARGMSIITGRTIEIAASSILPPGATAFTDQYAQRIIAELAPFRHGFRFYASSKFSRVLAYTMNRGKTPWKTKDIEDYAKLKLEEQIDILNAMVPEGKERFYSVLNPLEIGGILSRTGWRISGGGVTMIDDLVSKVANPDEAWIGTGVQIERKRARLVDKKAKEHLNAVSVVDDQLKKIGERTPLRLFLNIRSVQNNIVDGYLKENGIDVSKLSKDDLKNTRSEYVKRLQSNIDELILLQEKANQVQQPLDTVMNEASDTTKIFVSKIRGIWDGGERNHFLKILKEKEWATPYTFGADDVPYDQYSFETTGMRSVARRWGDMASAAKASKALNKFVSSGMETFTNQEQIIEAMREIYNGIKGYNEDDAKKFVTRMAEGVMKFYGKDYKARLPLGIGTLIGMITGKASYAQIAYGRGAMAWDELQLNEFTRLLRNSGMLTIEQQHELQNKAGGGKKEVAWGYARTVIPLLMLAVAYYMFSKVSDEKT